LISCREALRGRLKISYGVGFVCAGQGMVGLVGLVPEDSDCAWSCRGSRVVFEVVNGLGWRGSLLIGMEIGVAGNDGCIRRRLRWTLKGHVERELAICEKNVLC
jgi:hypothetical protein